MELIQFMNEYIHILETVLDRGYSVDASKQKVLQYKAAIADKVNSCLYSDDPIVNACRRIWRELGDNDVIVQDTNILHAFGINEQPAKVLYTEKEDIDGYRYVLAFISDYDPYYDVWRARNGGCGEKISICATTRADAYKEVARDYHDPEHNVILNDISEIYEEPAGVMYHYRGYLWTYRKYKGE